MCGIAGFTWADRSLIRQMTDRIAHRGPDGQGEWVHRFGEYGVSLGHRRLAILDLSERGQQPMLVRHKSREIVISFNGEIYNFVEIRTILEKRGYQFTTSTD